MYPMILLTKVLSSAVGSRDIGGVLEATGVGVKSFMSV